MLFISTSRYAVIVCQKPSVYSLKTLEKQKRQPSKKLRVKFLNERLVGRHSFKLIFSLSYSNSKTVAIEKVSHYVLWIFPTANLFNESDTAVVDTVCVLDAVFHHQHSS